MKIFHACNPNSPEPIITVVTANLYMEIVEKPHQLSFTIKNSIQIRSFPIARMGVLSFHSVQTQYKSSILVILVNSWIIVNLSPPHSFCQFGFPRKNHVSSSPFLCCDYYFALTAMLNPYSSLWCVSTVWLFAAEYHHHIHHNECLINFIQISNYKKLDYVSLRCKHLNQKLL